MGLQFDNSGTSCVLCPTGCDTCSGLICTSCLSSYTKIGDNCLLSCVLTNNCPI